MGKVQGGRVKWTAKYFTHDEMACSHCGKAEMDQTFMNRLDSLREAYGKPIIINSAYRCPQHPVESVKNLPGVHASGKAVDVSVDRGHAYELMSLALDHGFTGIGVQQKGKGRFLHLDIVEEDRFLRPTIWSY